MIKLITSLLAVAALAGSPCHADDRDDILQTIERFSEAVDNQDGAALRSAFHENAALFATNQAGDALVSMPADTFAKLHAEGRFGGQAREVQVNELHVVDGLLGNAVVVSRNAEVHYTYYLGVAKLNDSWKIQSLLQRSKPASVEED